MHYLMTVTYKQQVQLHCSSFSLSPFVFFLFNFKVHQMMFFVSLSKIKDSFTIEGYHYLEIKTISIDISSKLKMSKFQNI